MRTGHEVLTGHELGGAAGVGCYPAREGTAPYRPAAFAHGDFCRAAVREPRRAQLSTVNLNNVNWNRVSTFIKFRNDEPVWIYVLRCEGEKYYIGATRNLHNRLIEHFSGEGAIFTKKHKPQSVLLYKRGLPRDEDKVAFEFIRVFGLQNACGGRWARNYSKVKKAVKSRRSYKHFG